MEIDFLFTIAILIMSVVIHEVAHGYAALSFGDPTARLSGRLTLNPAKHLDPVGSFIVPALAYFLGGFIIGWAKPVPYNPYNFSRERAGTIAVALAGAAANFLLAIVFGILLRVFGGALPAGFFDIAVLIILINLILGVFNLVPVPPLDGSKLLFALLPYRFRFVQDAMERYWIFLIFILLFFAWRFIVPVVGFLFTLVSGIPAPF